MSIADRTFKTQSGQALVSTLLLTVLLSLLVGGMAFMLMSDRGQMKVSKKRLDAFYAAESADQAARAYLQSYIDTNFKTAMASWSGSGAILNNAQVNAFFDNVAPQTGTLTDKVQSAGGSNRSLAVPVTYTARFYDDQDNDSLLDNHEESFVHISTTINGWQQAYVYRYTISAYGAVGNTSSRKLTSTGQVVVSASADSFAKYALFTNTHLTDTGAAIWFTDKTNFDGPVHTNGTIATKFRFIGNPGLGGKSATFGGDATSTNIDIQWYHAGGNTNPPLTDLHPKNPNQDVPVFSDHGYQRGVANIPLPTNAFSQERAAFGDDPGNQTAMTNNEKRLKLGLPQDGLPLPGGIYTPSGGGLFVQGNVDSLIPFVDGSNRQVYDITQGNIRKRVTLDTASNQTLVETYSGGTLQGTATTVGAPSGIIQVNGSINFLGGPQRDPASSQNPSAAPPAIQQDTALTISATGDVVIQRDLKYQSDPRGVDGQFGTPDDNLAAKNVLGLYSSGGNVRIGSASPYDIAVHGSVMASASGKVLKVDNYNTRAVSGSINLLGGAITERYGAVGTFNGSTGQQATGYGRNFVYDRRFQTGTSPPYFPTTGGLKVDTPLMRQIGWKEETK